VRSDMVQLQLLALLLLLFLLLLQSLATTWG
jgi:hypothetical protein